jgi:chaperone modulatory protein CbpM
MSHEIDGILLEDAMLNLDELARSCQVSREWIIEHVQCGVLLNENMNTDPALWVFDSHSFMRTKKILAVERDFECNPELAGLVADMAEEIALLRDCLQRTELGED